MSEPRNFELEDARREHRNDPPPYHATGDCGRRTADGFRRDLTVDGHPRSFFRSSRLAWCTTSIRVPICISSPASSSRAGLEELESLAAARRVHQRLDLLAKR